jgi:hypothetical protein
LDGSLLKGGFTSNDWHRTFYSNLADNDYTVMVNGKDGVWSWDGANTSSDPAVVAVTNLSKGNPAVCTVAAGDIGKFHNGDIVVIAGAVGTGLINANGAHMISSVGSPANTFTLVGVDTSTAAAAQTSGVTADPPSTGMVKEAVLAPSTEPWVDPNKLHIVVSHMNRLFFADEINHAFYYLPLQQKSGTLEVFPMNALVRRGGTIRAMASWTIDGGAGMDDCLVIFTSHGEAIVFRGTDPDSVSAWELVGIFTFDAPMGKNCVYNYGGDLFVLISTGLVPMSTFLRAETEQLGQADKDVVSAFTEHTHPYRASPGWSVTLDASGGRMICNMPTGTGTGFDQMVRFMPNPVWASWSNLPSRCWAWLGDRMYFGSADGKLYEMQPIHLSDSGQPINVDVQMAWSNFGSPAIKHFKMVKPFITTDGLPRPYIDMRVEYDDSPPSNRPDVTQPPPTGSTWDVAAWDVDGWTTAVRTRNNWSGVGRLGTVGAIRMAAQVKGCTFSLSGFDCIYEQGSVFG